LLKTSYQCATRSYKSIISVREVNQRYMNKAKENIFFQYTNVVDIGARLIAKGRLNLSGELDTSIRDLRYCVTYPYKM